MVVLALFVPTSENPSQHETEAASKSLFGGTQEFTILACNDVAMS